MFGTRRSVFYVCYGVHIVVVSSIKKLVTLVQSFIFLLGKCFVIITIIPNNYYLRLYILSMFLYFCLVDLFFRIQFFISLFVYCVIFLVFIIISCSSFNYFPSHWKVRDVNRTLSNISDAAFVQKQSKDRRDHSFSMYAKNFRNTHISYSLIRT